MNCGENGKTTLLMVDIPYFRKVILMAFECEHCNWRNNEIESAKEVQDKGVTFTLSVKDPQVCRIQ